MSVKMTAEDRNSKRNSFNYRSQNLNKYYEKRLSQSSLNNPDISSSARSLRNKNQDSNKTLGSSHTGTINEGSFISSRITYDSEKEHEVNDSMGNYKISRILPSTYCKKVHELVNLDKRCHPDYLFYAAKQKGFTKKASVDSVGKTYDSNNDSGEKYVREEVKVSELKEEEEEDPDKIPEISFSREVNVEIGEGSRNSIFKDSLEYDNYTKSDNQLLVSKKENTFNEDASASIGSQVEEKINQLIQLKKGHNKRNSMQHKINNKLNDLAESKRKSSRHQSFGGQKESASTAGERLGITGFLEMKKKEMRAKRIIQMREEEKTLACLNIDKSKDLPNGQEAKRNQDVFIENQVEQNDNSQAKTQRSKHTSQKSVDLKEKEGGLLAEFKRRNNSLIEKIALEKLSVVALAPLDPKLFTKERKPNNPLNSPLELTESNNMNVSENKLGTPTFFKHEEFFPSKEILKITTQKNPPPMEETKQEESYEAPKIEPRLENDKRDSVRSKKEHSQDNSVFDEEKFNELESLTQVSSHFCSDSVDIFKANDSAVFVTNKPDQISRVLSDAEKEETLIKSQKSGGAQNNRSSFFDINGGDKEEHPIKSQKSGGFNTRSSFFDINGGDSNEDEDQKNVSGISSKVARENLEDREEEARMVFDKVLENINVKNFLWIKTILKPHEIVLNMSSALIYLITENDEEVSFIESKNWKKIQGFFVNPNEILKKMHKFRLLVEEDKIKEANIERTRSLIVDIDKKFSEISDSKIFTEFASKIYEFLLASLYYYENARTKRTFNEDHPRKISPELKQDFQSPEERTKESKPTQSIFSKAGASKSSVKNISKVLETKKNPPLQKVQQKSPKTTIPATKIAPVNKGSNVKTPEKKVKTSNQRDEDEEDINIIRAMIKKSQAIFSKSSDGEAENRAGKKENLETPQKSGRASPSMVGDKGKRTPVVYSDTKKSNNETPGSARKRDAEYLGSREKMTSPSRIRNYIEGSAEDRKEYIARHQVQMESEDLIVEEEEEQAWKEMMEFKREISRMLWDDERRIKRNREEEFLTNLKKEIELYFEKEKLYQENLKEKNKHEKEIWKILRKEFFEDLAYFRKIAEEKEKLLLLDDFTRARKKKEIQDAIEENYRLAKQVELKEREEDGQILKSIKIENEIQQKAAEFEDKKQKKTIERQYRIAKAHNEKNIYKEKLQNLKRLFEKREYMYEEINNSINIDDHEKQKRNVSDSKWIKNRKRHVPWFEEQLPPDYFGYKLPEYISIKRNQTIIAIIIQIASSIAGLSFFFIRRASLYLIINSISAGLAIFGLTGTIKLKHIMVAIHGVITTAVLGSCFLYSLIEAAFGRTNEESSTNHNMSESWIIFLLSLPYLIDFCSGCISFYFFYLINNLEEQRNPKRNRALEKEDYNLPQNCDLSEDKACIICLEKPKNSVFYNCGHKIACISCAKELVTKFQPRCPCCRAKILDVIQEFAL